MAFFTQHWRKLGSLISVVYGAEFDETKGIVQ